MIRHQMKWHNVAAFLPNEEGQAFCSRIPSDVREALNPLARKMAVRASGAELRFRMQSNEVKLTLLLEHDDDIDLEARLAEVYHGCFPETEPRLLTPGEDGRVVIAIRKPDESALAHMRMIAGAENAAFAPDLVRVLLPMGARIGFVHLEGEVTPPEPGDEPAKRWLAYGSSITYGASAPLPSGTYVARAAAKLRTEAINLGFPGSALLDPAMAEYIAGRQDWDFATLELGINVIWDMQKQAFVPVETFKALLDHFLPPIAERHPDKWIFCIDIFSTKGDIDGSGLTQAYRDAVRTKAEAMNLPRLIHLDGRELLPEWSGLSEDLIHPSARGMELIAAQLAAKLKAFLSRASV